MNARPGGTDTKTSFHLSLGDRGEMIAGGYLGRNGFKILEKNYRCRLGEIDAIASKKGRLYFIEVKTRSGERFGRPEEAVTAAKRRKLVRLAQWYLAEKKIPETRISFCVLAILWRKGTEPEIRMIEDAFGLE